jgi:hypothetical protein
VTLEERPEILREPPAEVPFERSEGLHRRAGREVMDVAAVLRDDPLERGERRLGFHGVSGGT